MTRGEGRRGRESESEEMGKHFKDSYPLFAYTPVHAAKELDVGRDGLHRLLAEVLRGMKRRGG